jgi:hypothetical protein
MDIFTKLFKPTTCQNIGKAGETCTGKCESGFYCGIDYIETLPSDNPTQTSSTTASSLGVVLSNAAASKSEFSSALTNAFKTSLAALFLINL